MNAADLFEALGDFDPSQYEDEVKKLWGETDAYRESARRTRNYTKVDWERIHDENAAIAQRIVYACDRKVPPEDAEAMDVAEAARLAIDRNFYPCSHAMHILLSEAYVNDPRFRAHYDDQREGLADWFAAAIRANGDCHS